MSITADMVKTLRERSGAGMMECKKALAETGGDMEQAMDLLRKAGQAKADKKAGRVAAEGVVLIEQDAAAAVLVEVNCETDFAAKNPDFQAFAQAVAACALRIKAQTLEALLAAPLTAGAADVAASLKNLIGSVGENMAVRRVACVMADGGTLGAYSHKVGGVARIGAVARLKGGTDALARDIAMHVAASRPAYCKPEDMPREAVEREKAILIEQARDSGKPIEIIEKMVQGRLQKYLKEQTLVGQPFIKDPDTTVEKLLKDSGADALGFVRFELGEGIEKKSEDFASEVKKAAGG
jgi:elongation factor Ts